MAESQNKNTKPIVYSTILEQSDSEGIVVTASNVIPQYSGMSFVRFYYSPGDYIGTSIDAWYIGIVRKPFFSDYCEIGNAGTPPRKIYTGEVVVIPPNNGYRIYLRTEGHIDFLMLTNERFNQALHSQHQNSLIIDSSKEAYFYSQTVSPLLDTVLSSALHPTLFDSHHTDNYINGVISGIHQFTLGHVTEKERLHNRISAREIKLLVEYINASMQSPIKNTQLSSLLNMPETTFCKAFKASTGESPYQFVLKHRIDRAKILLATTELPLADISYNTGFSSQSHMTDVFRTRVGASPAMFRKMAYK